MSKLDTSELRDTTKAVLYILRNTQDLSREYDKTITIILRRIGFQNMLMNLEENPDGVIEVLEVVVDGIRKYTDILENREEMYEEAVETLKNRPEIYEKRAEEYEKFRAITDKDEEEEIPGKDKEEFEDEEVEKKVVKKSKLTKKLEELKLED